MANHTSLQSALKTLVTLFTNDIKIVIDDHVLYHLGKVVSRAHCGLKFVGLVKLTEHAVFEFRRFLRKVFYHFDENILVRKLAFGFVNVHVGDGLFDRICRLRVFWCGLCDLVDVLVITDEIGVFEEDESMRSVGVKTLVAVGVAALVASKNNFASFVRLYFAIGF
jgi:hypothetical protein